MAATVGQLVVMLKANTGQFSRDMKKVRKSVKDVGKDFKEAFKFLAKGGILVAGLAYATKKVFDIGAAVEETGSKFKTVFGPATADVQKFVDEFGVMAGLSQSHAKDIVATTGAIVQGMGLSVQASAKYAEQVVRLAGDLASFNNIPIEETSRAIQAAITGERESMKRLGVVILETDVQKKALVMTGKTLASTLTQEEKAMATLQLISERAGVAVGDLARTQDSAANTARRIGAQFQNLKETIAVQLMPVIERLLPVLDSLAEKLGKLFGQDAMQATQSSLGNLPDDIRVLTNRFESTVREIAAKQQEIEWLDQPFGSPAALDDAREEMEILIATMGNLGQRMLALRSPAAALAESIGGSDPGSVVSALEAFLAKTRELAGSDRFRVAMKETGGLLTKLSDDWKLLPQHVELSAKSMAYFAKEAEKAAGRANRAFTAFTLRFTDGLIDALLDGSASFKEFANSVLADIARIAARMAIFEALKSFTSKGDTGWFSSFVGGMGAAWGFGGGKAGGGPVSAGRSYMVGERGPELFTPGASGNIAPNGAGGTNVYQNISFNAGFVDGRSGQQWLRANAGEIARIVGEAARNSSSYSSVLAGA